MEMSKMVSDVKEGDQVTRKAWNGNLFTFSTKCFRNSENNYSLMSLNHDDMSADDWQVIPAKKEMVSFPQWMENESVITESRQPDQYQAHRVTWDASAENQDLLYADLMEMYNQIKNDFLPHSSDGLANLLYSKICAEIDKVNAVLTSPD